MNFIQMNDNDNELSRSSGDDPSGDSEHIANSTADVAAATSSNNDTDMGEKKLVEQGQLKSGDEGLVINDGNNSNDFIQQLQYQQEVMQQQMFAMNNGNGIGGLMGGLSKNMTIPLKNGDDNSNNNTTQHIKTMEVNINNNGAGSSMGQQQPDDSIHRVSGNTTDFEIPDIAPPQVENNNSSAAASEDNSSTTPPPPQKEKSKRRPSSTRKSSPSKSKKNTDDDEPMDIFHGKGSFPLNLTLMLESVHSMELNHIVSWSDSGTSFIMHDPALFLTEVMPKFFK